MITKRLFLAGSAASAALRGSGYASRALAGSTAETQGSDVVLTVEGTELHLLPEGTATEGLRFAVTEADPLIRVHKGHEVALRVMNNLAVPTSLRWDGLRGHGALDDPLTAASNDIPAGQSRIIRFAPLDSGTTWFHAAADPSHQTARGLRGVLIVDEPGEPSVDEEFVALLADWLLSAEHKLLFGSTATSSAATVVFTVNGEVAPHEIGAAPGSRIRLRLVNGSVQRVMLVACEGVHPTIIAIDGQPSEMFKPVRDVIPIGPGARFDYVIDLPMTADSNVRLIVKGTERASGILEPDRPLLTFRTTGSPKPPRPPLAPLIPNPALPRQIPLEASKRAELVIDNKPGSTNGWTVNGVSGVVMPATPILKVKRGDAVTLGFTNKSFLTVPLRVNGHAMRLLHVKDDGWEPYWRDSVLLPPTSRNHVAFMADLPGRWPIEAAFDDMALGGLRCWFEVTST